MRKKPYSLLLIFCLVTSTQVFGEQTYEERKISKITEALNACRKNLGKKQSEYDNLASVQGYLSVAGKLRICLLIQPNKDLNDVIGNAEIEEYLSVINDQNSNKIDKRKAMERLVIDYPEVGKQFKSTVEQANQADAVEQNRQLKIQEQVKRAEMSKELRQRKMRGVSFGMSPEEVRASNWGRPQSVNRTTEANGTSEVWNYEGTNYLYFQNGRLTTIHH